MSHLRKPCPYLEYLPKIRVIFATENVSNAPMSRTHRLSGQRYRLPFRKTDLLCQQYRIQRQVAITALVFKPHRRENTERRKTRIWYSISPKATTGTRSIPKMVKPIGIPHNNLPPWDSWRKHNEYMAVPTDLKVLFYPDRHTKR